MNMDKRIILVISALLIVILAGLLLTACGSSSTPTAAPSGGSTLDGKTLLQTRCTVCHDLSRVTSRTGTADQWKAIVDRMINNGAQLTPQEETVLVNYLAQTYK
jgi:hypothetical protein